MSITRRMIDEQNFQKNKCFFCRRLICILVSSWPTYTLPYQIFRLYFFTLNLSKLCWPIKLIYVSNKWIWLDDAFWISPHVKTIFGTFGIFFCADSLSTFFVKIFFHCHEKVTKNRPAQQIRCFTKKFRIYFLHWEFSKLYYPIKFIYVPYKWI